MTGFLSVLEPRVCAPHLQPGDLQRSAVPAVCGTEQWFRLSAQANALLGRIGRQAELWRAIMEVADRMSGRATELHRHAERIGGIPAPFIKKRRPTQ